MLLPGDPVPSFFARGLSNPRYSFDSAAGRYLILTFLGSSQVPGAAAFLERMRADVGPFDDLFASAFIVSQDGADAERGLLRERYPGLRIFIDADHSLARLFGATTGEGDAARLSLASWILDPGLRVLKVVPVTDLATHDADLRAALGGLTPPAENLGGWAPVLMVPNVFEPEFCRALLDYANDGRFEESGYMQTDPATGQTIMRVDHGHKRRSDCSIEDEGMRSAIQARILRRLVPQVERAYQFKATRMERYLIARYDADTGGHFRPHKDNTTLGTAHRRFAVSIGLNADNYEGGDLRFPAFGPRTYRPPTGGAIVFSCSLLHEAMPVTSGRRYVFLPFLYDEEAAKVRLENAQHLQDPVLRDSVIRSVSPLTPA